MKISEKSHEIVNKFCKFVENGDRALIEQYSLEELKQAKYQYSKDSYREFYKAIEDRIIELEKYGEEKKRNLRDEEKQKKEGWWQKPLFINLIRPFLEIALTGIITWNIAVFSQKADLSSLRLVLGNKDNEIAELKKEIQVLRDRRPELPVTVEDKTTGNQLYIGRPIAHRDYYEFPITLNDGQGFYRIDQYKFLNEFKGMFIIVKEQPNPQVPPDKINK